jgi:hypothetical protein
MPDLLSPPLMHALSWCLLAELARRHPDFHLRERDFSSGSSYTLELTRPVDDATLAVYYSTNSAYASVYAGHHAQGRVSWPLEALVSHQTIGLVRMMEESTDLESPLHAPSTTLRALTYRLAADIIMTTLNDKRAISVHDTSFEPDALNKFLLVHERNSYATEAAREGGRYWTLSDDKNSPVAILDTEGYAYTSTALVNLSTTYTQNNRSLHRTTSAVFADLL